MTKCQVCERWGKPVADFWEELVAEPMTNETIMMAQTLGDETPDFVRVISRATGPSEEFRKEALFMAEYDVMEGVT